MTKSSTELNEHLNENIANIIRRLPNERLFWTKILSAIDDPLFIVDENKEIVFFNKKAEEVTGFTQEDVIGKPCLVGIRCVNCLFECALFKEGQVRFRNLEFVTKSGKIIKVVKNAETFTDEKGNIIGGVETFRDVTKQLRMEEKNAKEKATIELILNSIGDGVIALDGTGTISFANEKIAQLSGHKASDLIGKPIQYLLDEATCHSLEAIKKEKNISATMSTSDSGGLPIELSVLDYDGNGINGTGKILLLRKIEPTERVRKELAEHKHYHDLISRSPKMIEIFNLIETISDSDVTVLIEGESGTGKELVAKAIHAASSRKDRPFNVVNCAVFNENLLESELFGHCQGAFTGAISDKIGRFEMADGGTVFLDEIGEMPANLQVKLLRFLQNREFERVGEVKTRQVDVRIIAATNKNLVEQIEKGEFRDDLYFRLNVIPIFIPPLRERTEDIALLADHFIDSYCNKKNISAFNISDDAMSLLMRHRWSGNVRELENVLLHAMTCADGNTISAGNLPKNIRTLRKPGTIDQKPKTNATVEEIEKSAILDALRESKFNRSLAAQKLGITRTTLWRKIKKYKLEQ